MEVGGGSVRTGSFYVLIPYVLIPLVVVAATALAYYGYRLNNEMARQNEQSSVDTTAEVCDLTIERIERLLLDSEDTLITNVPLDDLSELGPTKNRLGNAVETIRSVLVLDSSFKILPGGNVSAPEDGRRFADLFERRIIGDLRTKLATLSDGERFHLHKKYDGRDYLLAYARRDLGGKSFYVVLENDMYYMQTDVLRAFDILSDARQFQIVDGAGEFQYGHGYFEAPAKYQVTRPFPQTLTGWRVRMAPSDARALAESALARRRSAFVLIAACAVTLFGGLATLFLVVRAERRSSQLKSEFIANVSHELKTPLSLIRMFGEMLATGRTKGEESAREYAQIITRESERLSRLIDNVLDFARIERGKVSYEFRTSDLAEVLSRGLDVYRWRLDRDGIKLKVDISPDLPLVKVDENAMTLVLLNLVDNAVKYAGEGKELAVSVSRKGDRVVIAVADRGPGIPPDEKERVFERFYRSRSVRGRSVRGSGIGLSLVKHIAEAHGGGVSVDSELGKGSTFTIWLPVAAVEAEETGDEAPAASAHQSP